MQSVKPNCSSGSIQNSFIASITSCVSIAAVVMVTAVVNSTKPGPMIKSIPKSGVIIPSTGIADLNQDQGLLIQDEIADLLHQPFQGQPDQRILVSPSNSNCCSASSLFVNPRFSPVSSVSSRPISPPNVIIPTPASLKINPIEKKETLVSGLSANPRFSKSSPNKAFSRLKALSMFVLERKTVPAQLMLLILQFEPVNPIAFSKSSRRYLTEEIRNLELVIRFALKKASFFKQFPKLGHQVLSFFKPISFNTDISLDSELALVKERLDVQDWMIKLFSGYLVQQFLKCTMLIEARMSMSDNFLLPLDHFLFVESNKSSDWSSYHAPDGDCSDNWYFYNYWLPNVIKAIDKNKLVKLLDNPQSIFGLFKFYLTRALALNSTFVQFRNTKLVLLDPSLRTKRQRAYLQSLLVSTGPELRRSLSSLIGPRLAIIFLIGPKLVIVFLMGAFSDGLVRLSCTQEKKRIYDW